MERFIIYKYQEGMYEDDYEIPFAFIETADEAIEVCNRLLPEYTGEYPQGKGFRIYRVSDTEFGEYADYDKKTQKMVIFSEFDPDYDIKLGEVKKL